MTLIQKRYCLCALTCLLLGVAGLATRAQGSGIPSNNGLIYSGKLEDGSGEPLEAANVEIKLWDDSESEPLCTAPSERRQLSLGRFSIALPDKCAQAIKTHADVWVQVIVDGSPLQRTKLGAVPYAVETDHAINADNAAKAMYATSAESSMNAKLADRAKVAEALPANMLLGTTTNGTLEASSSTTQSIVLVGGATYILSATLFGANTDVHETYVVNVPFTPNLNVDYASLRQSSYNQGGIDLQTQNGTNASSNYGYNPASNYTIKIVFSGGEAATHWSYSLIRLH